MSPEDRRRAREALLANRPAEEAANVQPLPPSDIGDQIAAFESLVASVFALPGARLAGTDDAGTLRVAEALEAWRQSKCGT